MRMMLSDEQQLVLELIATAPVPAIPELEPYTMPLLATRLIALSDDTTWEITPLGEAMLQKRNQRLH
jgi:hypothetical protein